MFPEPSKFGLLRESASMRHYMYSEIVCYKYRSFYAAQLGIRFMQLREFVGFHSGITDLTSWGVPSPLCLNYIKW